MIQAEVHKSFRASEESAPFALNVELEAGEGITVLFGPSGAGKTLTMDLIAGFLSPDTGRIVLDGEVLFDSGRRVNLPARARRTGYVFQNYALFPHMTLRQNLEFAAEQRPGGPRIDEVLERFRLSGVAGRRPVQLSGGQKQRGSIARALVGQPRLLLLDEPARGLDAPLRQELYSVLAELRTPVLLVTHDLDECYALGERMVVMREGRAVQSGTPEEVADAPVNADVARLLGNYNVLPAGAGRWKCIQHRHVRARAWDGELRAEEMPARVQRVYHRQRGLLVEFSGGVLAEMAECDERVSEWALEFPPENLRILS